MSRKRETLRARRAELVAEAAAQREEIARGFGGWRKTFDGVDRVLEIVGRAKRLSPVLGVGVGLVALLATRSGRARGLFRGATTAWRSTRSALRFVSGLRR